jgi:riboflavin biosynthesis pyrimidine reductase
VGGPRTIETYRALGVLDELVLVVLPYFLGAGKRLTDGLSLDPGLRFASERPVSDGAVEIAYAID